jgi:hypothetical protein
MLGWLVDRQIAPHIPVIDKAMRTDGTWSRTDFEWDADNNQYVCPEGEELKQFRRNYSDPNRGPDGNAVDREQIFKSYLAAIEFVANATSKFDRTLSVSGGRLLLKMPPWLALLGKDATE